MTTEEQTQLQTELTALRRKQPSLSFKDAWNHLQETRPYLFTDGGGSGDISASALLAHNRDIRKKVAELMKYASAPYGGSERPAVGRRMLVQAGGQAWYLDEYDNPIGTLAQQFDEMHRHGKRNNQEAGSR